ncbi:MAG: PEP-CTERM sorting domain-containing protein [Planctomycetota bacterium]|jgi:hypothetical protein
MKKRSLIFLALIGALLLATVAYGEDYNPPPWSRTDPGATTQIWEFETPYAPAETYGDILPTSATNPGNPVVNFTKGWGDNTAWLDEHPDASQHTGVWVFEDDMIATIPNYDVPNPEKEVWVQLTYLADTAPILWLLPEGVLADAVVMSLVGVTLPDVDGYVNATWNAIIEPNPLVMEEIWVRPAECTVYVDELVIDTICRVPEPTTIGLLGFGILGLLRKRK